METLLGAHLIAGAETSAAESGACFRAIAPSTGRPIGPEFPEGNDTNVNAAVEAATAAREVLALADSTVLADLLDEIARQLDEVGDELLATANAETAIEPSRLESELFRATGQLRLIGEWVRRGEHLDATIDHADPQATPPRPDLRRLLVPLGPVAVFGASNFPLAFGVPGGDTASALAAGCPVVAKAHPAHPSTSVLAGRAITSAVSELDLPAGTFSLLHGAGTGVGASLARHPGISAVAFTGSLAGGRALYDLASQRTNPIPVYAEMGSSNPLLVTGRALAERAEAIAEGLGSSLLLGTGQFCTSPGLLFIPAGPDGDEFVSSLLRRFESGPVGCIVSHSVLAGLRSRLAETKAHRHVDVLYEGPRHSGDGLRHQAVMLSTTAGALAADPDLLVEHFGPVSLVVRYTDHDDLMNALSGIEGTLTFTIHAAAGEVEELQQITQLMAARAGRIIWNGYPTGVSVVAAMHHGGPYPATTSALHTSVGPAAIRRFQRPVAYQDAPSGLLPPALQDANPLGLLRRVNGAWHR